MHTRHATHPALHELAAFALGKLPQAEAERVARHLEACPLCAEAVKKTPADSFLGLLNQAQFGAAPGSSIPAGRPLGQLSLPGAATPDLPPELAQHPKFQIVRRLGQGGMGTVYHARHKVMDRDVALKVINPSLLEHPSALPRFFAEVKAAARLDHPNIVRAYDAEVAGGLQLFVMEYVEGHSLAQVVERKGPLPVAHACNYVHQAALGLQHAFEQGMVHRDIKPANLMLTPRGKVKVLDFGLARLAASPLRKRGDPTQGTGLTQVNTFMGTPEYVAPEQATDARGADIRADLYSLGCTLFCLLAGRPPFQADTALLMVLAHLEQEAPPLHQLRPEVPAELSAVVARLLAKDPGQRYQKPVEVAQALVPFCKLGQPSGDVKSADTGTRIAANTSAPAARDGVQPQAAAQAAIVSGAKGPPFEALEAPGSGPTEGTGLSAAASRTSLGQRWPLLGGIAVGLVVLALGAWLLAGLVFKTKVKTAAGEAIVELKTGQSLPMPLRLEPIPKKGADVTPPEPGRPDPPLPRPEPGPLQREPKANKADPKPEPPKQAKEPNKATPPAPVRVPDEPVDPYRKDIEKARTAYNEVCKRIDELLLNAIAKEIEFVRKQRLNSDDQLKIIQVLTTEKQAFEENGTIPWSPMLRRATLEYLNLRRTAELPLRHTYEKASASYIKAGDDKAAGKLLAEKNNVLAPKVVGIWKCTGINFRLNVTHKLYMNGMVDNLDGRCSWTLGGDKMVLLFPHPDAPKGVWIDTCTFEADGQSFTAKNQKGATYQGKLMRWAK